MNEHALWFVIAYMLSGPVQLGPFETEQQCQFVNETLTGKGSWSPRYDQGNKTILGTSGCWRVKRWRT